MNERNAAGPLPRERFSRTATLSEYDVSEFAQSVGDTNPLHHDPAFATATRLGRPIASGTHTTALLRALTASHYSPCGAMLGLEFWVKFKKPIFAGEQILLVWLVIRVTPNERLDAQIIDLRGGIRNARGETALGAKGTVLVGESARGILYEPTRNQ